MRKEKETKLSLIASSKSVKLVSATLFCLMLAGAIVGSGIKVVPTKATPAFPWEGKVTLGVTRTLNPHWGYYGGYFDLWARVKPELAKIGITLETLEYSDFDWFDRVWDTGWNKTFPEGWDMIMIEWWLQPHCVEPWFESMVLGDLAPWPAPEGYNIQHWNNTKADKLLLEGMQAIDAEEKKDKIWSWQEWFMYDPPWASVYMPRVYEVVGSYVEGYNPSGCWFYDMSQLRLNPTTFEDYVTDPGRKAAGNDVLIYAVSEDVWALHPTYMDTYTEEQMRCMLYNTLYKWGIKPEKWPDYMLGEDPTEIDPSDWTCIPDLAAEDPIMSTDGMTARIKLKEGVKWSDDEPLTARDVQFTFNTCSLNIASHNTGYGDLAPFVEGCEYVDEHTVNLTLKYPMPMSDLKSVLSNDWGVGTIMPFHKLKQYMDTPGGMRTDASNIDFEHPASWLPVSGPFVMTDCDPGDHIYFENNTKYFGWKEGWGPHVSKFIFKWIPDAATRLLAMEKNEVDFGEYPTGPVSKFKELNATLPNGDKKYPNLRVFQYTYPATNAIWFNLDNPIISNRFIRLAIAHAIPYKGIIGDILPGWGIETAYRGLTHIMPCHRYTEPDIEEDPTLNGVTVGLYNTELAPFEYNIPKAIRYMELWWYSQSPNEETDFTKAPLGDADFSGFVEMPDYYLWVDWYGAPSAPTGPITFLPGQDVDPDWDNSGTVGTADFPKWAEHIGWHYP